MGGMMAGTLIGLRGLCSARSFLSCAPSLTVALSAAHQRYMLFNVLAVGNARSCLVAGVGLGAVSALMSYLGHEPL